MSYRKKHFPPKAEKNQAPPVPPLPEYHSTGVERSICSDKLTSGLPYQRPVDEKEVDRLIQEWDERLLEPLTVSFRDGRFNIVDGQHRIAAMRKMNGGNEVIAACKVYSGLTYQQEADLCYKLDKAKKRLSLSQSTNALAESGEDTEVLAVKALVEQSGFVWALNQRGGRDNESTTTRATINAYRTLGGASFTRMLELIRGAWHGNPRSLTAAVLTGMTLFLKTYETELNDRAFITQLSKTDPDEITRRGKLDYSTNKAALRYARVILEKYNGQRRESFKLPYRFQT